MGFMHAQAPRNLYLQRGHAELPRYSAPPDRAIISGVLLRLALLSPAQAGGVGAQTQGKLPWPHLPVQLGFKP